MAPIKPGGKVPGRTDGGLPPSFHPLVQAWFTDTYGEPTAVQGEAWPLIARGEHVLALAPTGSGKTLTAFLGALSRFIDGTYPPGVLSVLYVSPLKALNEDIRRNLLEPIASLSIRFARAGLPFPEIPVETRSGDTPQSQRRRFLIKPPSILALTPESLAILLLNPRGRRVLSSVRYLILDEVHAVLGTKRGSFLACQIDRLALIAGEFQRVGLSATVRPPEAAAEFTGGLKIREGKGGSAAADSPGFSGRPVHIVAPAAEKSIDFRIAFPPAEPLSEDGPDGTTVNPADRYGPRYTVLTDSILERIAAHRHTGEDGGTVLVFTDSRRRAERIAFLINQRSGSGTAFVHHGSLARELRRAVEQRLAQGKLPCVVATGSLELGIDIGVVEEVILAGSPGAAVTALQRIGRSGHGVGLTSRGLLVPFNGQDLILAAALGGAVRDREIEETRAVKNPLDVLAQIILALCVEKSRSQDELYHTLRGFQVFHTLSRSSYDQVIRMLTGRYAVPGQGESAAGELEGTARLRELKPRLYLDALTGELTPAGTVLPLLYSSGGVIPSRGYYSLRLPDGTKIGELDEEFVWERRLGDSFDFGGRSWRIISIGSEAVEAAPLESPADYAPFWRADAVFRSPLLVRRTLELFDALTREGEDFSHKGEEPSRGGKENPGNVLGELAGPVLDQLRDLVRRQRRAQGGVPLPGTAFIPVEIIDDPSGRGDAYRVLFHGFRGGAIHYPLALAVAQDLEDALGVRIEVIPDDNAVLFLLPRGLGEPENLIRRSLLGLDAEKGEQKFRRRLEPSGIFGAAFREAAERSLVLPRAGFGKRTPLWVLRERAKRLFDAVRGYGDFPVIAEAWRSCLQDQFDIPGFRRLLEDMGEGSMGLGFFRTPVPSPFARDITWKETNILMYTYDERPDLRGGSEGSGPSLSDRVIAEALGNPGIRPPLSPGIVSDFSARLRRELAGWAPEDELGLCEWVKERIAIPLDEWELLMAGVPPELRNRYAEDQSLDNRIGLIRRDGAALPSVVHREWAESWRRDALPRLGPWLRYEGPVSPDRISAVFGVSPGEAAAAAERLAEAGELVRDAALSPPPGPAAGNFPGGLVCDRENMELLLRLSRKKARPAVRERPISLLTPYLAIRQGLPACREGTGDTGGAPPWKTLAGFSAPVELWETEFFPARFPAYTPETLDRELAAGRLLWYGAGKERAGLCLPEDLDLVVPENPGEPFSAYLPPGFMDIPRDFWEIKEALSLDTPSCIRLLWEEAWRGRLSADSWEPLRRGITGGFSPPVPAEQADSETGKLPPAGAYPRFIPPAPSRRRRVPRALRDRWKSGPPIWGRWFSLVSDYDYDPAADRDPLDEEELNRDRVRLLLTRWGVLCRPLLEREAGPLSWSRLLPAMRRLELAGELAAGRFFGGINSLQFASPGVIKELEAAEAAGGLYWMNAADPASPAGLGITGLDPRLPARIAAARLCFRGAELLAVSGRNSRDLSVFIPPEDPGLEEALAFLKVPRTRAVHPRRKIVVETINGQAAAAGPYGEILRARGFLPDRGSLVFW
jgi:ATP-dependent Lhr-like helicase